MNALLSLNPGEARRRQANAKERRERMNVGPDVRARRAALLDAREAAMERDQATLKAEQDAAPDALRAVLSRGTVDELAEISRMISRLDGRRLQALVDEVFRDRARVQRIGGAAMPPESPQEPVQTRGRQKATLAA